MPPSSDPTDTLRTGSGQRPWAATVKRDRGRRPSSPAVPSRLTSRQPCPTCTTRVRATRRPVSPGGCTPGTPRSVVRRPARRLARPAGPGRPPDGPGSRARCRPTGCPRRAAPDGGWHHGRGGRHSSDARRASGQRRERPQVAGIHQPLVARRPGHHHRSQPRGSGDRGGARERLAALGGGIAVRVVTELGQHPCPQHHPKPGLAAQDRRVRMGGEPGRKLLLQRGDLLVEAAQHGHQGADDLAVGRLDWPGRGQLRRRQRIEQTMQPTRVSLWLRPSPHDSSGTPRSEAPPTTWAY
jgi:hypothetical protein